MIITESIECRDSPGSVVLFVVMYKGESLAQLGDFVLGRVDASNVTKGLEQFLKVGLLRALRQVRDSNGGRVFGYKN